MTTATLTGHNTDCIDRAAAVLAASGDLAGLTSRQQFEAAADALTSGDVDCAQGCPSEDKAERESETTEPETVAYLTTHAGWGAWVKVTVADTPAADAAAADFFRRACAYTIGQRDYAAAHVDEEHTTALGEAMTAYFYPTCEHGMSAHLCAGPGHYPADH